MAFEFTNFFQEHQSNLKKTWGGICDLINVSKKSGINIRKIIHDNKTITDNEGISNSINNFFVNIGSSVEAKVPAGQKRFRNYFGNSIQNSVFLQPCTPKEIEEIISEFGNSQIMWTF